ncbi:MAG: rhomboid family intramembrane serine protease [Actinomycetota bacterium]
MPDRYSFSSPFASGGFGRGGQPWFVLGNVEFTTTVVLIAINVFWMFVYAAEGPSHDLTLRLWLVTEGAGGYSGVLGGEVWRIFTYPLVAEPSFWTVLGMVFFYIFGNQMEALMGRRHYLGFVVALTIVPALAVTFFDAVASGFVGGFGGIDMVQFGVIIAFVAQYPTARFFFGIPAPVMIGVFVGLRYLAIIGDRDEFSFVLVTAAIATALVVFKSLGYAHEVSWIPRIPLPASMTGQSAPAPRQRQQRRRRSRGRGTLSAVPTPPSPDPLMDMEIDALLDQVAEQGLDSLTKDQRKRLEEHSKRLRKRKGD